MYKLQKIWHGSYRNNYMERNMSEWKKAKGDTLYDYICIKPHKTQANLQCRKVDLRVSWHRDGLREEVIRQLVAGRPCYQTVQLHRCSLCHLGFHGDRHGLRLFQGLLWEPPRQSFWSTFWTWLAASIVLVILLFLESFLGASGIYPRLYSPVPAAPQGNPSPQPSKPRALGSTISASHHFHLPAKAPSTWGLSSYLKI